MARSPPEGPNPFINTSKGWKGMSDRVGFLELRRDDKGKFDELAGGPCTIHFEMMDDESLWIGIDHAEDATKSVRVVIYAKSKLRVLVEDDSNEGRKVIGAVE
jgi:hypothetical protein